MERLNTVSVFMTSLTSCRGSMVEMNVTVDSTSAEPAAGGATAKCRSSRPPLVDGSHDAQQENAGEMAGILKNRLQNVSINFNTERSGTGQPTVPAHVCGVP